MDGVGLVIMMLLCVVPPTYSRADDDDQPGEDDFGWSFDAYEVEVSLNKIKAGAKLGALKLHDEVGVLSGSRMKSVRGSFIVNMHRQPSYTDSNGLTQLESREKEELIQRVITASADPSQTNIKARISHELGAPNVMSFTAMLSPGALALTLNDTNVDFIEQDVIIRSLATNYEGWNLDRLDQAQWSAIHGGNLQFDTKGWSGKGVDVYILDSGVNPSHLDYQDRLIGGINFAADQAYSNYADCNGHGTHVASSAVGTMYGVAKEASLFAVRTLQCDGSGSLSALLASVNWVLQQYGSRYRPAVASLSLGLDRVSPSLNRIIDSAVTDGVTFVVAAGNENQDACAISPASAAAAITVGATDHADRRASFSNYGACVDIFAPGTDILGASHLSQTTGTLQSGTSMAAPHVAGAAAIELQVMAAEGAGRAPADVTRRMLAQTVQGAVVDANPTGGSTGSNFLLQIQPSAVYNSSDPNSQPTNSGQQPIDNSVGQGFLRGDDGSGTSTTITDRSAIIAIGGGVLVAAVLVVALVSFSNRSSKRRQRQRREQHPDPAHPHSSEHWGDQASRLGVRRGDSQTPQRRIQTPRTPQSAPRPGEVVEIV